MKPVYITTSWDDGHVLDIKLAKLLNKYNIKGTFYIAPEDFESPTGDRLTDLQVSELSKDFEIGGHTITHRSLVDISDEEARDEIKKSRQYIEKVTGKEAVSFCYPRGEYKSKHSKMVKEAGFKYARTIGCFSTKSDRKLLEAKTTVNAYDHWSDFWSVLKFSNFNIFAFLRYYRHWDVLAMAMFDKVQETGGNFHLWGHSWEIDEHNDWQRLENVLSHISNKQNAKYVTNGELVALHKEKVLIVIPYFPPYLGGTQLYALNIAKRLRDVYGWDVCIATSGIRGFKTIKDLYEGLTVYRMGFWFKVSNTPINPLWFFTIRKIVKSEEITIINAHAPVPFMSDIASLVSTKAPFILTYHSGKMVKSGHFFANVIIWLYENTALTLLMKRADYIICSSDFVRFGLLSRFTHKSTTITPAVDVGIFKPIPKDTKGTSLLFVAGLTKSEQHKGLKILINAFNDLHKTFPELRLVVVGDGNMRPEYEEWVKRLNLQNNIVFKGKLQGASLVNEFQQSDIFVLPSLAPAESFGMVIVEAMATGKPVVGSTAGGIPLVIDNEKTGLLVDSGDSKGLALAIKRLIDDPALAKKFGEAGRKKAEVKYDWSTKVIEYDTLLRERLDKKPTIAQIVGYFPPHLGGMEVVAEQISIELARQKYPVKVFTTKIGANKSDELIDYQVNRLNCVEIAHTPIMWSLFFRLLCLPKDSILHVHVSQALIPEIALIVAKLRGFSVVAHFHLDIGPSSSAGVLLPLYKKHFLARVMRAADRVIVFSEDQLSLVKEKYSVKDENIVIIPNGVADKFFIDRKVSPSDSEKPLEILSVGRLAKQKRPERLIEAVKLITKPVNLRFVGDGDDKQKLIDLANKYNLKNVSFEGKKFGSELIQFYNNADIFVISSDIEGMPLVVIEAMATGLPIVGTNVLGTRELVSDTGILVNEPYPENFAKVISGLVGNYPELKKLSDQSMNKAKSYSWTKLVDKLGSVYREIN